MSYSANSQLYLKHDRQFYDDVAWEKSEIAQDEREKAFRKKTNVVAIKSIIEEYHGERERSQLKLMRGSFNAIYKAESEQKGDSLILRIPIPGLIRFPDEKVLAEVAIMRCIAQNTTIPIPRVSSYGLADDNPTGLGPYIIMDYVENEGSLATVAQAPQLKGEIRNTTFSSTFPEDKIEYVYSQMADHLLQLSNLKFPRIGSLAVDRGGQNSYSVARRPMPMNLNTLIDLANVPPVVLPSEYKTYTTADEWYLALADMHIAQLLFQHNDAVFSSDDCRNKYVARQLFRRLAKEGKLSTFGFADDGWSAQSSNFSRVSDSNESQHSRLSPAPDNRGDFRLWCDDIRGGNILVNEDLDIVALIDWEFAYVGPTQFALDPPWWLLLEEPEQWLGGINSWKRAYERSLKIWLLAMEKAEEKKLAEKMNGSSIEETIKKTAQMELGEESPAGRTTKTGHMEPVRLSTYMRESWETGRFWLNYAARKSWAFDSIYWMYLDERFFGDRDAVQENDLWKTKVDLLTQEEREAMEPFVRTKMEESKERILVDWDPEEAKERMMQILF